MSNLFVFNVDDKGYNSAMIEAESKMEAIEIFSEKFPDYFKENWTIIEIDEVIIND